MTARILASRYELFDRIGNGGMAVVYKARDRVLNRYVAVKVLKPEFTKDLKFIENFKNESHAAAALTHPNIVNVYDVGHEGNVHYIVMELIEGEALSDLITREAPLDYKRVIEITRQVASALSFAHKHHIIHRDVKPHNIMLTQDGIAKITDFGIAKAVNDATFSTGAENIMGSVHYFSPEQARGGYVDEKSDIYSLGIVMYEMLTGKVPFDGKTPVEVALKHINDPIIPPSQLVDGIPPRLEQIVMKATDKIQVNRYLSADELIEALDNLEFITSMMGSSEVAGVVGITSNTHRKEAEKPEEKPVEQTAHTATERRKADKVEKKRSKIKAPVEKKPKEKKGAPVRLIAILLALVLALPIGYVIAKGINDANDKRAVESIIKVPHLEGMEYTAAAQLLEGLKLQIKEGDEVFSDYDEGIVVSSDPVEGAEVKAGKTITVNVSKGVRQGTIPKITGTYVADAKYKIEKYNYKVGQITYQKSSAAEGVVISQSPEAGLERDAGSYVNFVVSLGMEESETKVPYMIGKPYEEAKAMLEEKGLSVGEIKYGKSVAYGDGCVMWQGKEADATVQKGSKVDLMISYQDGNPDQDSDAAGQQSVPVTIDYSAAANDVFYLTVTLSDAQGTRTLISNQQRLKENGFESISLLGSGQGVLTVIMDNEVVRKVNINFDTGVIE